MVTHVKKIAASCNFFCIKRVKKLSSRVICFLRYCEYGFTRLTAKKNTRCDDFFVHAITTNKNPTYYNIHFAQTHVCLGSARSDGPDQADSQNTTYLSRVSHSSHAACSSGRITGLWFPVACACSGTLLPRPGGTSQKCIRVSICKACIVYYSVLCVHMVHRLQPRYLLFTTLTMKPSLPQHGQTIRLDLKLQKETLCHKGTLCEAAQSLGMVDGYTNHLREAAFPATAPAAVSSRGCSPS